MFTYILFGKQITGHHWLANRKSTLRPKHTFATVSGDGRYTTFPTQHILYCLLLFMHIYIYINIYLYQFYIYSHIDSDNHIEIWTLIALGKLLLSENWNPRIQESLIHRSWRKHHIRHAHWLPAVGSGLFGSPHKPLGHHRRSDRSAIETLLKSTSPDLERCGSSHCLMGLQAAQPALFVSSCLGPLTLLCLCYIPSASLNAFQGAYSWDNLRSYLYQTGSDFLNFALIRRPTDSDQLQWVGQK